ncbi:VCBS repeat-containing protein [Nocardiopsis sp. N85]|uniref:FG-GAP repeat domain-containing protein n=1 Tax=Nocardiopsis sp. N85 TaxID=3029400 RepID=UPI00237F87BF|nr:VCBS repeat-containing protein [Nocardiopsis sp. N85]MDE3723235.1 VCBS repeat-containing protein [Nocardiopsis sp. N85]
MRSPFHALRVVVALVLLGTLAVLTQRPTPDEAEAADRAAAFSFSRLSLNEEPSDAAHRREVAPDLEHFAGWISAVGAAVSLTDLRGNGRSADACLVDPRDDGVTIRAVPGSDTEEYPPVELRPVDLPYDRTMAPMGCTPADLDEDGDMDLIVHYWGRSPVLFLNTAGPGDGSAPTASWFTAHELVQPMQVWNTTTLNAADIDGSGHLDLLVGNYFPDGARVLDPEADDETRMQMQDGMGLASNAGRNRLLLTEPTGTPDTPPRIIDAGTALPEEAVTGWTLATGLQDLTGNGAPDVYIANDFGNDHLLVNRSTPGDVSLEVVRGDRDLVTPKSGVLGNDSYKGMGVTFTYTDGAALPTIVVSNITTPYALHESNFAFVPDGDGADLLEGRVPYRQDSESLGLSRGGWAWDVKAGDFDNDGVDELMQATGFLKGDVDRWPQLQELAMGNDELLRYPWAWPVFREGDDLSGHEHNPFWVRGADGRYADLAAPLGLDTTDVSRAIALGDVNGDGLLDAVVANQWEDSAVLLNDSTEAAPGIVLRPLVPATAAEDRWRPAIGATVTVRDGGSPAQTRQLFPSNGHTGVSAEELHLAAPETGSLPVTVTWRSTTGALHSVDLDLSPGTRTLHLDDDGTVK